MIHCKPSITYPVGIILVLWVLIGAIVLPNANHWLKGTSSSIEQDTVSFDLNQPIQNNHAFFEPTEHKSYRENVFSMLHTPSPSFYGSRGVLYHQHDLCLHPNESDPVPIILKQPSFSDLSKIVLIENDQSCHLLDKMLFAEKSGAVAAIVFSPHYEQDASYNKSIQSLFSEQDSISSQIQIPCYYVDLNIGTNLLRDIYRLNHRVPQEGFSQPIIRVRLLASRPPILDHWQFGLIIVGIMLASCIIVITILRCHAMHIRRLRREHQTDRPQEILTLEEQQLMNETHQQIWRYLNTPTKQRDRHRLEQHVVDMLPLRTFETNDKNRQGCVICLDSFEENQELRQLPCSHEYHRECIDKWLTCKNNTCPLCLQRIEMPSVPEQVYIAPTMPETQHQLEQSTLNRTYSKSSHSQTNT